MNVEKLVLVGVLLSAISVILFLQGGVIWWFACEYFVYFLAGTWVSAIVFCLGAALYAAYWKEWG